MSRDDSRLYARLNALHWDELFREHGDDGYYAVDAALDGGATLASVQLEELPNVAGLVGLHLQCGIGLDTLSLAKLGAHMTGVDLSAEAVQQAQRIAQAAEADISFTQGDVLNRSDLPDRQFDFVYTANGVLRWLPRLDLWAENIRSLLSPGGWFYLYEIHPLVYRLVRIEEGAFVLQGEYFDFQPKEKLLETTHIGRAESFANRAVVHTDWSISAVLTSLLQVGLRIDSFREHPTCSYSRKGLLQEVIQGEWGHPTVPIPLSFSIRASRVA